MGCDIHLYVEKRRGERWVSLAGPIRECQCTEKSFVSSTGQIEWLDHQCPDSRCWNCHGSGMAHSSWYSTRNYDLFAILADVRNGRGFAGVLTGGFFDPLDEPRGLPEDASSLVARQSEGWGMDGHSHSWFTLQELQIAFQTWGKSNWHVGYVNDEEYRYFKTYGKPNNWEIFTSSMKFKEIANEEMEKLVNEEKPTDGLFTKITWEESYQNSVGEEFVRLVHQDLPKVAKDPDSVRIVFWFDN